MKSKIKEIRKIAEALLSRGRGSHDLEHTNRVYELAVIIAKRESADLNTVKLAALLHDISRHKEDLSKGKVCHAKAGAKEAEKIMSRAGFESECIKKVCGCIRTHRYRGNRAPETLEAKVLFDADKLDSIGAVGIGRAFLFAGEVGADLFNKDADISKTKPYTKEDTAYREYMVKLRHIKGKMLTKTGKKIAGSRHEFMKAFFKRLVMECAGTK